MSDTEYTMMYDYRTNEYAVLEQEYDDEYWSIYVVLKNKEHAQMMLKGLTT